MANLNNPNPTPPKEIKAKLKKESEEKKKFGSPERTNDSDIDPKKPKKYILKGFHGG